MSAVHDALAIESDAPKRSVGDEGLALLRAMALLRAYDERAVRLHRQGRIGPYPPFWGEEGIQAGAVLALRESDWLFPTYRQNAVPILRGMPPQVALAYFRGDPDSLVDPRPYACAPQCVPLATHIPHAVGLAWGRAMAGEDTVALAFFGDGATSEGDFHEGLNLAGVLRAPVILLCTNNRWAISTPVARQTAAAALVDKGVGYGIAAEQVDGFDAAAVYDAVARAAARARRGDGPTLIEALCYRIGPHATADDPDRYRDPAEAAAWRASEPLVRLSRQLLDRGVLDRETLEAELRAAEARIEAACGELTAPVPRHRRELISHTLVRPAPLLEAQIEGRVA